MIVGLDMGGTHIDAIIIKNGRIINTVKRPNDPKDLFKSIWSTLEELLSTYDKSQIKRIQLSTTISTNAIVERKTSPVAMIIQSGPGLPHDFLACGEENLFVSGYVDHRGHTVQDLDKAQLSDALEGVREKNINNCAIVSKFSVRNPQQELKIKDLLKDDFSTITMGHTLSGKLNFPRRVFTSYLNSSVCDTFSSFAKNIKESLEREGVHAPIYILKADGGTMSLATAENMPVETILSGPSASFMGIKAMLPTDKDALLLDVGGTTTDIFFLAGGSPLFEPQGIKIGDFKTLVRAIYSVSIGLGGDSRVSIEGQKIKIGPQRDGRAYAYGGPQPTPTDAMIVLGYIDDGNKLRAVQAMEKLAKTMGLSPTEVAQKILSNMGDIIKEQVDKLLNTINSQPVYTINELLYGKKIKPQLINIIGGPAKVLASILEAKFSLPCYFPKNYHIANAIGAGLARTTMEINMLIDSSQGILSVPELGIYKKPHREYNLNSARERAIQLLKENLQSTNIQDKEIEVEIIEESSFNMVRAFSTSGKNIRIRAQVKPGLIYRLEGGI